MRELEKLGDTDLNHLQRATAMGRALCTHDQDFLLMAAENFDHHGIIFAEHTRATIGGWVRALLDLHSNRDQEFMLGVVLFVSVK